MVEWEEEEEEGGPCEPATPRVSERELVASYKEVPFLTYDT